MRKVILSLFVALSTLSLHAISGVQPVVILYAPQRTPAYTMDQVRAAGTGLAAQFARSSYGAYTLSVEAYGPFVAPADTTLCSNTDAYGRAVEQIARDAGVVFPAGYKPIIWWDCGHKEVLYRSPAPGSVLGIASDGKELAHWLGVSIGLPTATAEVLPAIGTNAFDPYTPMGYMGRGDFNAYERWLKGWLPLQTVIMDDAGAPSVATHFIEIVEAAPSGLPKLWRLSNGVLIDVRNVFKSPIVELHLGDTALDLDPYHLCRWYTLTVGQVYTRGDGIGIRTDSVVANGATISAFPYNGPITATCPVGSK